MCYRRRLSGRETAMGMWVENANPRLVRTLESWKNLAQTWAGRTRGSHLQVCLFFSKTVVGKPRNKGKNMKDPDNDSRRTIFPEPVSKTTPNSWSSNASETPHTDSSVYQWLKCSTKTGVNSTPLLNGAGWQHDMHIVWPNLWGSPHRHGTVVFTDAQP